MRAKTDKISILYSLDLMQVEIVNQYDTEKIQLLRSVRKSLIVNIAKTVDSRKILTFLKNACVIGIDEERQEVVI